MEHIRYSRIVLAVHPPTITEIEPWQRRAQDRVRYSVGYVVHDLIRGKLNR